MLTFSADAYFHIGQMHLNQGMPCQDYAFSAVYRDTCLAVVSDGCSTGRHTDIGSRVIALSTAMAVKGMSDSPNDFFSGTSVVPRSSIDRERNSSMKLTRQFLGLDFRDMLATCNYAVCTPYGGFTHLYGDGAIAIVMRSGEIRMFSYQWDKNAPLYPIYAENDHRDFIKFHGGDSSVEALTIESWLFTADKEMIADTTRRVTIEASKAGSYMEFSPEDLTHIDYIAVFTDGVFQVGNLACYDGNLQDWRDIIVQLVSFKNSRGEFAKRRIMRFLKTQKEDGMVPLDDIGYAVLKVDHSDEKDDAS